MKVLNKTFVVTGGGNGLGREIVLELLKRGSQVAAVDIDENSLDQLVKDTLDYKDKLKTYSLNIMDFEQIISFKDEVLKDFKKVDGLINVAGVIQPFVKINDLDYDSIRRVMDINLYGTLYMVKTFLPEILKLDEGHIVNFSSMGGFLPVPGQAIYGASKAAVKLMTEALYAELKDTNVKVTLVFPGAVKTNIAKHSIKDAPDMNESESKHKMLSPEKAALLTINAIEKNKLYVYYGSDSRIMNKLYRLMPKRAVNIIAKKMGGLLK